MITQPKPLPTANAPQEGFVLIVGLVILGLLTMLALSGMRDSTIQEKMAGLSAISAAQPRLARALPRRLSQFRSPAEICLGAADVRYGSASAQSVLMAN